MNPLSAFFNMLTGTFLTASRASQERQQQGPQGLAYDKSLADHSYAAQYQAWIKEHGTQDGFAYRDPVRPPSDEVQK